MLPIVSVILPTYNREALLGRAIRSVLAQSLRELELIVVDDASTDGTAAVVQSFAVTDPRLIYIRQPYNQRAAAARNLGIRRARGEFVAFQDDDDFWFLEKLEKQLRVIRAAGPAVGLNLCAFFKWTRSGTRYVGGAAEFNKALPHLGHDANKALISTPSWLARKEVLVRAGFFDERMRAWDDWEYSLRIGDHCRFSHLEEPLWVQDWHGGGAMARSQASIAHDLSLIVAKHSERWARLPRERARNALMLARVKGTIEGRRAGLPWAWTALRATPGAPRAWLTLLAILLWPTWTSRLLDAFTALTQVLRRLFVARRVVPP